MKTVLKNMRNLLAVALAFAMVLGSVPQSLLAAEVGSDNNAVEATTEDVAVDAVNAENADGEELAEDPLAFKDEIKIALGNVVTSVDNKHAGIFTTTTPAIRISSTNETIGVDPDNNYSFVVSPDKGYSLKNNGNIISKVSYDKYWVNQETSATEHRTVTLESGWSVTPLDAVKEPGYVKGSYVVTFPGGTSGGSLLEEVAAGALYDTTTNPSVAPTLLGGGTLTVTFRDDAELATAQTVAISPVTAIGSKVSIRTDIASDVTEAKAGAKKTITLSNIVKEKTVDYDSLKVRAIVKDGDKVITNVPDQTFTKDADPVGTDGTTGKKVADKLQAVASVNDLKTQQWIVVTGKNYKASDATYENSTIVIHESAIAEIYNAGYTLALAIDGTSATQEKYAATYADNSFVVYGAAGQNGEGTAPDSAVSGASLAGSIKTVAPKVGTRTIKNVWYVAEGTTTKVDFDVKPSSSQDKGNITITSMPSKNITVYASTYAPVAKAVTADTENYDIYGLDGDLATKAEDGKKYSFAVVSKKGYKVSNVQYRYGEGEYVTPDVADGVYTTKTVVNDNVVVKATLVRDDEVREVSVKAADNYTASLSSLKVLGDAETGLDVEINDGTTTAKAVKDQPFFIAVKAAGGKLINSVSYSAGGVNKGTLTAVSKKSDGTVAYRIPSATDAIEISVNTGSAVTIKAPISEKVIVDGYETGATATVASDTMYQFTIRPASDAVTIKDVYAYDAVETTYNGNVFTPVLSNAQFTAKKAYKLGTVDSEKGFGTFTITPEQFGASGLNATTVGIYATTDEEVDSTKFKVVFLDTASLGAAGSRMKYEKSGSVLTPANITSQELDAVVSKATLDMGTNTKVYPVKDDGSLDTALTAGKSKWSVGGTGDILTVVEDTGVITAKAAGTESLTLEYSKVESTVPGNKGCGNTKVYTSTLPVKVADRYSNLTISATIPSIYPLDKNYLTDLSTLPADEKATQISTLKVTAIDGQTQKEVDVVKNADVNKITWLFDPDITGATTKEFFFYNADGAHNNVTNTANQVESFNDADEVKVVATKVQKNPINVKAIVYFAGDTEGTPVDSVAINVVDEPAVDYHLVRTMEGAVHGYNWLSTGADDGSVNTAVSLYINSEDAKSETVSYKLYQSEKGAVVTAISTEAGLKAALKEGLVEEAEGVTFGEGSIAYYNSIDSKLPDENPQDYVTYSKNGAEFTFGAKAPTGTNYVRLSAPSISVDGVKIPNLNFENKRDVKVSVEQRASNYFTVDLITYDSVTGADSKVTVYESYPTTGFIAGRSVSEVVDMTTAVNHSSKLSQKRTGIEFLKVSDGTSFRLPKADEMTQIGSKRTLVGWQKYTNATTPASEYYEPGAFVKVNANSVYRAIWAEKYTIVGLMNGNAITKVVDPEDPTGKNKIDTYKTPIGDTVSNSNVPVVLAIATPKLDLTNNTTSPVVNYTADPAEMLYVKNLPSNSLSLKEGSPTNAIDGTKLTSNSVISGVNKTAGKSVTVTAKWADPEVPADVYEKDSAAFAVIDDPVYVATITSDQAVTTKVALVEGQTSATVTVSAFTKDAVPQLGNPDKYSVAWSIVGDNSIAKLSEGTSKWAVVVTPLKQSSTAATLKVTIKSSDDVVVAEKTMPLSVGEPSAKIVLMDADGNTLNDSSVLPVFGGQASTTSTYNPTTFKFRVLNGAGTDTTTFTSASIKAATTDNKVTNGKTTAMTNAITASDTGDGSYVVPVLTNDEVEDDEVTVQVVKNGVTYEKTLKISSYFKVLFKSDSSSKASGYQTYVVGKDGKKITDKNGDAKDGEIRLTTTDRHMNKAETDYTFEDIDISGFTAEYVDNRPAGTAVEKSFSSWKNGSDYFTATIDILNGKVNSNFTGGVFALDSAMFETMDLSISPSTTVTLENTSTKYKKTIYIGVSPANTTKTLKAKADKTGFYDITPVGSSSADGAQSFTGGELVLYKQALATDNTRTDFFTVQVTTGTYNGTNPRAGTVVFSLYNDDTEIQPGDLGTITVHVNGLDKDPTTKQMRYYENGELVKNDFRVVDGNTYYFDGEGIQITGSGITEINGKKVLIVNGVIAEEGTMPTYDGHRYAIGANGEILTGWLDAKAKASTAAAGTYYASPAEATFGQLVTGLQIIDGKHYVFAATDNKVARATNTKGEYENLEGYYVNASAEVAMSQLFNATIAGVSGQYLADDKGALVTYSRATEGKFVLNGVIYVIDKDTNEAKPDHTEHTWTYSRMDWNGYNFQAQTGTVSAIFTCEVGKEEATTVAEVKAEEQVAKVAEGELAWSAFRFTATANNPDGKEDKNAKDVIYKKFVGGAYTDATEEDWKKAGGSGSEGHEIDTNPTTEEEIEDISADKFKAYQVEPTLNLYDKNATVTVYFVGTTADPDKVEFEGSNSYYEIKDTLTGSGYTKAVIGIKDSLTFSDLAKAEKEKKLTFKLFKGESYVNVTFSLKVNKKLPSVNLSVKSGTAYANADGEYNAVFTTTDKNGVLALEGTNAIYVANKDSKDAVTDITVDTEGGITQIKYANAGAQAKGGLYVTNDNWVEGAGIFAAFKISNAKANAKPAIKLGKTSAKIAAAADQKYETTALLGGAVSEDLEVTPVSGKSSDNITADLTDGVLSFTTTEGIAAGTYEFTVNTKSDAAVAAGKAVTFKLTVVDASKATASFTVKGKLDSIADDTAVYITVKPSGAEGVVELTDDTLKAIENNKLTATDLGNGVFKIEKDVTALMSKDNAVVPYLAKGNIVISDFKVTVGGVAVNSKKAVKVSIPVVFGKLTASGTGIDFRGKNATDAATGSSSIEAVYTYSIYNEAGKVVGKNYYTFAGSSVELKDAKAGKLTVTAGSDGLVTVTNPSDGKDYNGTVKVTVTGTDIKAVSAKFKVLGKVKK